MFNNLTNAYVKVGKTSEATTLIRDRLARARKRFHADSLQLAGHLATAGNQLLDLKEYANAELLLREGTFAATVQAKDKSFLGSGRGRKRTGRKRTRSI